jgi:tetratricopeptide (TPR) repeat protein
VSSEPPAAAVPILAGESIAFTGRLSSMTRKEARLLVARLGGAAIDDVTGKTTILVIGAGTAIDWEDEKNQKLRKARAINAREAGRIRILTEEDFCNLAGVPSPAALRQQWYALHTILAMYPLLREDHLRYLQKWNLIQPALRAGTETYFAFADLAVIRQAHAELERGAPVRAVLRALQASREGQLSLDFWIEAEPAKVLRLARPSTPETPQTTDAGRAEELFQAAASLDDGDPRHQGAASRGYRRALEVDPFLVPAIINLANIHYSQEHLPEAEALYERAIAIDSTMFEAHFNLANVYHDVGRLEEALAAYTTAVGLNPDYADARFHLAVTLEKLGRSAQARAHWTRYLELVPDGEWSTLAREFSE